mmetsp:Transcript_3185/g.12796  ORF Transcript_3185/g.12796 Transcript_3185/m.12796 type:complete len:266 (-) Transcript_3185:51-848(-)
MQGARPARGPGRGVCRDLAARRRGRLAASSGDARRVVLRQAAHGGSGAARRHRHHGGGLRRVPRGHQGAGSAARPLVHRVPGRVRGRRGGDAAVQRPGGEPQPETRRGKRNERVVGNRRGRRDGCVFSRAGAAVARPVGRGFRARFVHAPERQGRDCHRVRFGGRAGRRRGGGVQLHRHQGAGEPTQARRQRASAAAGERAVRDVRADHLRGAVRRDHGARLTRGPGRGDGRRRRGVVRGGGETSRPLRFYTCFYTLDARVHDVS